MHNTKNVVYRDMDASEALTDTINKKLDKLDRFSDQILSSRVVLETPHQHKHKGKLFRAQIEVDVKGKSFTLHQEDPSIHVAVRDLFKATERKLKEVSGKKAPARQVSKPLLDLVPEEETDTADPDQLH